ncbi:hypothetical protein [Bacillus sp. EAC]|uniref:hypothetical protein n=1 Tax=Bacillus sp. EAC TaxID=1978338 RepID=UPI000B42E072|nr:hypothetical protein [Bacillus sp. EAC]
MKKILFFSLTLILILFGCEKRMNQSLDTSKLKKFEQPNLTKEQRKMIPITYKASSLEEGLNALPFKLKIPKNLPFKVVPSESLQIDDYNHNGRKLGVRYSLSQIDNSKQFVINVSIYNYKHELESDFETGEVVDLDSEVDESDELVELDTDEPEEIVQLKGGVSGNYTGYSTLGVSYELGKSQEVGELIENTLIFAKGGIYYELTFVANFGNSKIIKQYVNNIANQML